MGFLAVAALLASSVVSRADRTALSVDAPSIVPKLSDDTCLDGGSDATAP